MQSNGAAQRHDAAVIELPSEPASHRYRFQVGGALFAVLLFQLIFGSSYIGAFHNPKAEGIPLGVAAPTPALASQLQQLVEKNAGSSLSVRIVDAAKARGLVESRTLDGAYLLGKFGDTLLIANAASVNQSDSLTSMFKLAAAEQKRKLTVTDVAPLPKNDPRGLAPFYLVITWVVGGYLGATLLGLLRGVAAANRRLSVERTLGLLGYAIVSGIALTLLERVSFGVGAGHLPVLCATGALVVFAAASAASGLQALLGMAGTGVVLILFVALGNPSAGGAVSYHLLPAFYRTIGPYIVNGAGVDLVRNSLYFSGHDLTRPLLVLFAWAAAGVALVMIVGARQGLKGTRMQLEPVAS
jgi:hypothetical protein